MYQIKAQKHWYSEALKPQRLLLNSLPGFIGLMLIMAFHPFSRLVNAIAAGAWIITVNVGYDRFNRRLKRIN